MTKTLTIKRSEWIRGEVGNSFLLRSSDRKKCCLGFDALACGLTEDEIEEQSSPVGIIDDSINREIKEKHKDYFSKRTDSHHGHHDDTDLITLAMNINDSQEINDTEREAKLIPLLKELGYDEVVFID